MIMTFQPVTVRKSARFSSRESALPVSEKHNYLLALVRGGIALAHGRFYWRRWCVETPS